LEWIQKAQAIRRSNQVSQENKMNTKKKVLHHTMGSRGYAGKEETWQEQEEKAIQLGATLVIAN
jgi:hypothetical protein